MSEKTKKKGSKFGLKTENTNAYRRKNAPVELGITSKGAKNPAKMAKLETAYLSRREALTREEADYLRCILRPDLYTAKVPSIMPIPTHVSQTKGINYRQANEHGCMIVALRPQKDDGLVVITNDPALEESYPNFSILAQEVLAHSSVKDYAHSRRVVGAYIEVMALEPSLNRKGIMTVASLPFDVLDSTHAWSFDSVRDQPNSRTINVAQNPKAATIYTPMDASAVVFHAPSTPLANGAFPSLVAMISGAGPNANFAIKYRVVHEIVPLAGYTDLVVPTLGSTGSTEATIKALSKLPDPAQIIQQGINLAGGGGAIANLLGPLLANVVTSKIGKNNGVIV